ncbi:MAG: S1 RNA-binding domain-containing protein [Lachnospiraceae bacterium]|nr:S1 RNA-binding domain-containing protein [Lachnospiraceae bacterium]
MAETMDDFKKEIDSSLEKVEQGDVMAGKVETEEQAAVNLAWQHVKEMKDEKKDFTVKVGGMVNGGLIAYVENIRGFIPASQLSLGFVENLDEWLGKDLKVRIITADQGRKRLVMSAKVILKEQADKERKKRLNSIQVGQVVEGTVETIQDYGAFVNIADGVTGLLHVSQISDKRIKSPQDVLKVGDKVTAKVIKTEGGKISLSIRALKEAEEKAVAAENEHYSLPKSSAVTTNLGDLLKGIKL